MSAIFFNRVTGESGELIHLVPRGEFPHHESGLTEVYDQEAITAIVNSIRSAAQAPNWPGIYVGEEHFFYNSDRSSEAFGWVKEVEEHEDGIWGRVEWTDIGRAAVENRRFKLVSPVHLRNQVEFLDAQRIRPIGIDTIGLTNNPNLKGMVPMRNRAAGEPMIENRWITRGGKHIPIVEPPLRGARLRSWRRKKQKAVNERRKKETWVPERSKVKGKIRS